MAQIVHILLVDDNEGDILLTSEGLNEARLNPVMSVVRDGWEATQFLQKKGKYVDALTPDLVLLDINMPKMNGHEVLRDVKANPDTSHIPVVMFTTSSFEKDIRESYANHANCYITKPSEVDDYFKAMSQVSEFWFNLVKLPENINN